MGSTSVRPSPRRKADIVVVNPLGAALRHYTGQVMQTLERTGVEAAALSTAEPSAQGGRRIDWVFRYCRALRRARRLVRPGGKLLITWPVLGHFDRLLVALLSGNACAAIVMHDPNPLVAAVGYGTVTVRTMATIAPSTVLVVHGDLAQQALDTQGVASVIVAHPFIISNAVRIRPSTPTLRVLGQWKPDRDLELLARLGGQFPTAHLEIVGRGWPPVRGWRVRDEFVSEAEIDRLISMSSAILIPYRRFYQSGIAARALETAVPVIGRERELAAMTGRDYPFLIRPPYSLEDWVDGIRTALSSNGTALDSIRETIAVRALKSWENWVSR